MIDSKALVDDVMRQHPAAVGVFMRWRMKCVGCPFGVFHSIEHACEEHGEDLTAFMVALELAVSGVTPRRPARRDDAARESEFSAGPSSEAHSPPTR